MHTIVTALLSFLLLYKYWALFALTFSAAVILPVPMNTILLAAGAFAAQGYFDFYLSFVVAVVGTMIGDSVGYVLARIYGKRALGFLRVKLPPYMERFERFIISHARLTVFLTRFVGTVDSLANILAGFIGMPIGIFLIYDFLGNIISTAIFMYAGYFLGTQWQNFTGFFEVGGWTVIVLAALIFSVLWLKRYRSTSASHKIE